VPPRTSRNGFPSRFRLPGIEQIGYAFEPLLADDDYILWSLLSLTLHYADTDDHFERAAREGGGALQNPVQQTAETARKAVPLKKATNEKAPVLPGLSAYCDVMYVYSAPRQGLEPWT
jgi:hypothetical protein